MNGDVDGGRVHPAGPEGVGRAAVPRLHSQPVRRQLAVDQVAGQRQHAGHRVNGELVGGLGNAVVNLAIDAAVGVLGVDSEEGRVTLRVLGNGGRV